MGGSQFFRYHDGRFFNGLVVVAFELFDTTPNAGGFCCIPGTHKLNVQMPQQWRDLTKAVHPTVQRVPAKAGDAIIFTEVYCMISRGLSLRQRTACLIVIHRR